MATAIQISDALSGVRGPVVYSVAYQRRTHDNLFVEDITEGVIDCTITLDNTRLTTRSANFAIDALALPNLDVEEDHIGVILSLLVEGVLETFQLGLFHFYDPEETFNPNSHVLNMQAVDLSMHLIEGQSSDPYTVGSSTNYVAAVETVLDSLNLQHNIVQTSEVTPIEFTWAPGTAWMEIVNILLAGINYYPIWADETGTFTSQVRLDFADSGITVDIPYTDANLIVPPFTLNRPTKRVTNEVVVLIDDPARAPFFSKVTNTDGSSPAGTPNRNDAIVQTVKDLSLTLDEAMATTIAKQDLKEAAWTTQTATLHTMLDPRRGPHELYSIFLPDGISSAERWAQIGWVMPLEIGAAMTHTVAKVHAITSFSVTTTSDI